MTSATTTVRRVVRVTVPLTAVALLVSGPVVAQTRAVGCPSGTVEILGAFCIDRFEASLREVRADGSTRAWAPTVSPQRGRHYVAVTSRGVLPQGYISQIQARGACEAAGKRLCTNSEWETACRGPKGQTYPYGSVRVRNVCNDSRSRPVGRLFGGGPQSLNHPQLNLLSRTLARTGEFSRCTNEFGVYDMVGNLHEWVEMRWGRNGVFRGGYYADTMVNGRGCNYLTHAHWPSYHDYSTGFRCCADRH